MTKKIKKGDKVIHKGREYEVAELLSINYDDARRNNKQREISVYPIRFGRPMIRRVMYIGTDWTIKTE